MGKKTIEFRDGVAAVPHVAGDVSGITAKHYQIAPGSYKSVLSGSFTVQGASAAIASGKQILDLEKCHVIVDKAVIDLVATPDGAETGTPEVGIGTVVGSGANAVLSGVGATAEDCINGTATTQLAGASAKSTFLEIAGEIDGKDGSSIAKDLFLNVAYTASGTALTTFAFTITLWWSAID